METKIQKRLDPEMKNMNLKHHWSREAEKQRECERWAENTYQVGEIRSVGLGSEDKRKRDEEDDGDCNGHSQNSEGRGGAPHGSSSAVGRDSKVRHCRFGFGSAVSVRLTLPSLTRTLALILDFFLKFSLLIINCKTRISECDLAVLIKIPIMWGPG